MTTTISFAPTRCIMGAGKFDTDYRYIRAAASGAMFPLPKDRTVRITTEPINSRYVAWRYTDSVNVVDWKIGGGSMSGLGTASATLVKL